MGGARYVVNKIQKAQEREVKEHEPFALYVYLHAV
jgi:hypothetical protein